ncbi:MAG: carboxypeptidase-like regulatory domain-containing protein, partial [Bacteroidota bacterium]
MPHLYNSLTFKLSSHALAFFAALLFSLPAAVFAQRPVQGKVVDAATGEPLAGAIVQMKGASVQTATDSAGSFELIFPNTGNLFVQVELPGFYKKTARAKMGEPLVVALKKNEGAPNPKTFERKVSGKIVDRETCQPVAGASILVKGTSLAIATGEDGSFEITVPDSLPMRLIISGHYQPAEVLAAENEELILDLSGARLTPDCQLIPALTAKLASLTPSAENLGAATDPVQLLQAAVPGLMVTQPGSDPNGEYLLRLRGISTFVQRSQPLLVVDGLPEASWDLVSPDDIASVTVLGSAAAAARYGIRGAAGVVSVETKKGKAAGEPSVRYHAFLARQSLANEFETATPEEFIAWGGTDFGGRVDWMDEITRAPFSNSHHLSISSGGEHFDLRASAGWRNVQGVLKESGYQQINGRVRLRQSAFGDRLRLSANLAAASREMDFSIPEAFQHATAFHPTAPIFGASPSGKNHDGYFETELYGSFNPVAILAQNTDEGERKLQSGSLRGELRLADWLWLDATGSLLTEQSKRGGYSGMN